MSEPIYVDHAALENATTQLGQHHKTFLETLSELEGDLAPLMETWSGSARDLYVEKQKAWHAAATDLAELLGSIATLTGQAHTEYAQAVDDLVTAWT